MEAKTYQSRFSISTDYKNLPLGTYEIEFTALDRRYDAGETNEVWKESLTTAYSAYLEIIATRPPFSVEDLDSDRFGENNRLEYFDPNSELSSWIGIQSATDIFNQNRSISVVAEILEYNEPRLGLKLPTYSPRLTMVGSLMDNLKIIYPSEIIS